MKISELAYKVKGCFYEVHNYLGVGLLESAYELALMHELEIKGLKAQRQVALPLRYKDMVVDSAYRIDILVEDAIIIELKSVEAICEAHIKQLLNYLRLSGKTYGYLVNFNAIDIEENIIPKVNKYNPNLEIKEFT